MTSGVSFSARLEEVAAGYHKRPEVAALLAREADRRAKRIADQQKALADCAAQPACRIEMERDGVPESAVAAAVKAERDRALMKGQEQIHQLLMELKLLAAML